ncbi:unnamed protein product [Ixodes persulcatus]
MQVERKTSDQKRELDLKQQELDLEENRLELEHRKLENELPRNEGAGHSEKFKMSKLMQPSKVTEDIGLFFVNFERTCEKINFAQDSWSQRLLTLLPCEAADVVARLSRQDADDYAKVKAGLLRKYRLSTEAFRQRFRRMRKKAGQGYPEFAYDLRANLTEWLKSADVCGNHDWVIECVALEQFYRCLADTVRFWLQDKSNVGSVKCYKGRESSRRNTQPAGKRKRPRVNQKSPRVRISGRREKMAEITGSRMGRQKRQLRKRGVVVSPNTVTEETGKRTMHLRPTSNPFVTTVSRGDTSPRLVTSPKYTASLHE